MVGRPARDVAVEAGAAVLLGSSIKKELDLDWSEPSRLRNELSEEIDIWDWVSGVG
jgi:hypothetical protein